MAKHRKNRKQTSLPPPSRSPVERHRPLPVKVEPRPDPKWTPDILKREVRHKPDLRPVEDLRRVPHAFEYPTFRTRSGRVARTESRPPDKMPQRGMPEQVHTYFQDPERVLVCIRRDDRKRVLFALQRVGKGRKVSRNRTYTEKSYLRCK